MESLVIPSERTESPCHPERAQRVEGSAPRDAAHLREGQPLHSSPKAPVGPTILSRSREPRTPAQDRPMPFAARHLTDPAPLLAPIAGLDVRRERRAGTMAALQQRAESDIQRRLDAGHRAYVAYLNGEPAAFGWVATRSADIGELRSTFAIPRGERYLWNFVTLERFRGLGIYPRLVDAIVRAESRDAERFWIAYAPENHASGSGIRKAGFTDLAELSFDDKGRPAIRSLVPGAARAVS